MQPKGQVRLRLHWDTPGEVATGRPVGAVAHGLATRRGRRGRRCGKLPAHDASHGVLRVVRGRASGSLRRRVLPWTGRKVAREGETRPSEEGRRTTRPVHARQLCRGRPAAVAAPALRGGGGAPPGPAGTAATWLILPVVICLSQRLSHACLSINCLYCETANGSLNQLEFI